MGWDSVSCGCCVPRLNPLSAESGSFPRQPSAASGIGVSARCHPATLAWPFGLAKLNRDLLPVWQGQDPKIVFFTPIFKCRLLEGAELLSKRDRERPELGASGGTGGGLLRAGWA